MKPPMTGGLVPTPKLLSVIAVAPDGNYIVMYNIIISCQNRVYQTVHHNMLS